MTLALAIKATDAIIVAADSRGTIGDPRGLTAVNDTQQKIFQFGTCGLAISGAAELTQAIMDEFGKKGLNNPQNIDDAVGTLVQAASIYDGWFQGINFDQRPGILFVLGGYRVPADGSAPIPMVYLMTSNTRFAPQLAGAYPMMVGVPQYAVYLSHRYYDPAMTADSAAALAEYLISETASQDPKVGGPIRIAKVLPTGYYPLKDDEVSALKKRNMRLNDKLKRFFMSGGR
jgi:20S proteasome alpha/beta subunit